MNGAKEFKLLKGAVSELKSLLPKILANFKAFFCGNPLNFKYVGEVFYVENHGCNFQHTSTRTS